MLGDGTRGTAAQRPGGRSAGLFCTNLLCSAEIDRDLRRHSRAPFAPLRIDTEIGCSVRVTGRWSESAVPSGRRTKAGALCCTAVVRTIDSWGGGIG